eukprot:CAMPEP_0178571214 /NCGR_PEP_ID=MMETSP0697-20121206/17507_1 /TAXON_ID=265572 /ORGANISM="Extubocellulus spinifer, Strain CCMP396" /LENGTH=112 /DNA_ID=CAMNT_0020205735 /DNA_START=435 /DNA_END=774 /DNA_ORIENTATION=+
MKDNSTAYRHCRRTAYDHEVSQSEEVAAEESVASLPLTSSWLELPVLVAGDTNAGEDAVGRGEEARRRIAASAAREDDSRGKEARASSATAGAAVPVDATAAGRRPSWDDWG